MIKQRVITAAILAPIVILSMLYMPTRWFAGFLALVAALGAWEWASMVAKTIVPRIIYVLVCCVLMAICWFILDEVQIRLIIFAGCIYWVFILLLLSFYQSSWIGNYLLDGFLHYSGYFVIVVGWLAMSSLHQQNPLLLLFLFVLIWIADIAAYFAGKKFGRNKLAEQLSPGKTREGVLGAMMGTFMFSLLGVWLWREQLDWGIALYFVILCVLTALISVVGDLFESLLKRNAGKKDSGNLIPGHGGVLDRIDSLLAASPGFMLGLYWIY
ncbi:MAG: phosphatidate cytidylyltransferase [Gammaproteobacteria bacterium]|nr:phosphatidate cytidylyltransferase [Gammaproteobacteria bacterium]